MIPKDYLLYVLSSFAVNRMACQRYCYQSGTVESGMCQGWVASSRMKYDSDN
jgi:hypothetical protein